MCRFLQHQNIKPKHGRSLDFAVPELPFVCLQAVAKYCFTYVLQQTNSVMHTNILNHPS